MKSMPLQSSEAGILRLPQELIDDISDRVCEENFSFIRDLAFLSHAFLARSRQRQFATICIKNTYPGDEHSPARTAAFFDENDHLLLHPKTVDLHISDPDSIVPLYNILSRLSQVSRWNFHRVPSIPVQPFTPLSQLCEAVTEIYFSCWDLHLDILETVLPVVPSLTSLSISGRSRPLQILPELIHFPPSLQSLHLEVDGLDTAEEMGQLFSKITTLTSLTAEAFNEEEVQAVQACIDSNAQSLSDLKVRAISLGWERFSGRRNMNPFDLRRCVQLRTMDIIAQGRSGLEACVATIGSVASALESMRLELHMPYHTHEGPDKDYEELLHLLDVAMSRLLPQVVMNVAFVHACVPYSDRAGLRQHFRRYVSHLPHI
ncbi:hypothetical protein F5146DRAFT_1133652 [Armillaria mellea]|nr:hypothetical protein F5146DRAFT_1133652 [Armillaria mellea]